ncbi:MAG TPA: DUF5941 domain-containing protein [Solirubrobacteraceae bacterium]|jgi:hypothetical protein
MSAVAPPAARPAPLVVYRDDGNFSNAFGKFGRRLPIPSIVFAALAALLVVVPALVGAGEDVAIAAVIFAVMLGGLSAGRAEEGRFRWLVPPAIRLTEYGGLLWIGAVAGGDGLPAAFALLCALAYRHYDLVYRLRHRGVTPPQWVNLAGLGWDGRLFFSAVVLLTWDVVPEGFFIAAIVFGVMFVAESVAGWTSSARGQRGSVYEEEEDEGQ